MTSTIEANYATKPTLSQVLHALFPCGSITGAPKVSTMKIIAQIEPQAREVYCGAIGYVEPGGDATFNVAIRTVLLDHEAGRACYGVGGGITWDSTMEGEYEEAMTKTRFLHKTPVNFNLLETMKLERGKYFLLDHHMQRLVQSAAYFSYSLDLSHILNALEDHARLHEGHTRRVRLIVTSAGACTVESTELVEISTSIMKDVAFAKSHVNKDDVYLYHKTTFRDVYAAHKNDHPALYDVLLWNEEGQVTEFTTGNIIVEMQGKKWTPLRNCGLLAGTFRAHLLETGTVAETILNQDDVLNATNIWLINSVREWVPVRIVGAR
jgi:para-aminobenzoate synthetase/4-amino-4-deoxychorismate lyase